MQHTCAQNNNILLTQTALAVSLGLRFIAYWISIIDLFLMLVIILNKISVLFFFFPLEYKFCYIYNMAVDVIFRLVGVTATGTCNNRALFVSLLLNFFIIKRSLTLYAGWLWQFPINSIGLFVLRLLDIIQKPQDRAVNFPFSTPWPGSHKPWMTTLDWLRPWHDSRQGGSWPALEMPSPDSFCDLLPIPPSLVALLPHTTRHMANPLLLQPCSAWGKPGWVLGGPGQHLALVRKQAMKPAARSEQ